MEKTMQEKNARAKKMMLWFAMISMTMTFAGLTSAYVVSSSRADWLKSFELPDVFTYSTILLLLSSITFFLGKKALNQGKTSLQKTFLWATLGLTLLFVYFQFTGFSEIIAQGYYFTGAASSITTSFIYVLVLLHLAHVFGGLIVLMIVIFQSYKNAYTPDQKLGYELAELFWHFLDFLWIYLYVFVSVYS
ncbi:MAG: cytochrome c oxidase subunit 3 [Flavobacteriaceae bacterium]|jgi:cytochrome c oxidase subunit III|nr:cytochrome c oxidase subunit 3 [Flavobacteriaceae bacterium]